MTRNSPDETHRPLAAKSPEVRSRRGADERLPPASAAGQAQGPNLTAVLGRENLRDEMNCGALTSHLKGKFSLEASLFPKGSPIS